MKARALAFMRKVLLSLWVGGLAFINTADVAHTADANVRPKNIILMISDGTGTNTIAATGMYTGKLGKQIYDGQTWTKAFVSTYPLRTAETPVEGPQGLVQDPDTVYDPAKNWDTTPVATTTGGKPDRF